MLKRGSRPNPPVDEYSVPHCGTYPKEAARSPCPSLQSSTQEHINNSWRLWFLRKTSRVPSQGKRGKKGKKKFQRTSHSEKATWPHRDWEKGEKRTEISPDRKNRITRMRKLPVVPEKKEKVLQGKEGYYHPHHHEKEGKGY